MRFLKINALILLLWVQMPVSAQITFLDGTLSYQGELIDNGIPATGLYDIQFDLCFSSDPNSLMGCGVTEIFLEVDVSDGLFVVSNLDFGDVFSGGAQYWIQLSVRQSNSGDSFVALSPLQKINAVPYSLTALFSHDALKADRAGALDANGAVDGQYLKFNGGEWVPSEISFPVEPWTVNGSDISYAAGKVGIGNTLPTSKLDIDSAVNESPFKIKINGVNKLYVSTIGRLGVGSTNPDARLTIKTVGSEDSLSIISDNVIKFGIKSNGDIKQSSQSNGMLKYMLELSCNEAIHGGSTISKSYDGLTTSIFVSVSDGDVGETGICNISFPSSFNIQSRYIVASANGRGNSGSGAKGVQCEASDLTTLQCFRYTTSSGLGATNNGKITVLIY